jgi:transposase
MRHKAIRATHAGASIVDTAREFGVSRATLHRWLRAFDPDRPVASLRPGKRGPKGPRWDSEVLGQVKALIRDHPDWWGRHRVAEALAESGIELSETTIGSILRVAREQLAQERDRQVRAAQARRSRQIAAFERRDERDSERREMWRRRLMPGWADGLTDEERLWRFAEALASHDAYKIQVKDLTPELEDLADFVRRYFRHSYSGIMGPREDWLLSADPQQRARRRDVLAMAGLEPGLEDEAAKERAAILNYLLRAYRDGASLPSPPPQRLPAPDESA